MLPDAAGLDVLREIRATDGSNGRFDPSLPVVVVSGRGSPADRVRGLAEGADDYVVKPSAYLFAGTGSEVVSSSGSGETGIGKITNRLSGYFSAAFSTHSAGITVRNCQMRRNPARSPSRVSASRMSDGKESIPPMNPYGGVGGAGITLPPTTSRPRVWAAGRPTTRPRRSSARRRCGSPSSAPVRSRPAETRPPLASCRARQRQALLL
jgi:CheY-like chemotaxis protein